MTPAGRKSTVGLLLGAGAFLALLAFPLYPSNPEASRLAAIAAVMSIWWVTEAVPLFATALVPLTLFPLLGIMAGTELAPLYFNSTIVLFLGGFLIALTMEKWDLHRRIALWVIAQIGGGPARLVLGFMLASAFLSMWISNTATAVMMVPMALAVVLKTEETFGAENAAPLAAGLMLGVAYGCSIGGLTTLVGTPPNLAFQRIFEITFPDAPLIAFGQWVAAALPIGAVLLAVTWLLVTKVFYRAPATLQAGRGVIQEERRALGRITREERIVSVVFGLTALLWVFRRDLELGFASVPGWSRLLPYPDLLDDGTVAIAMASVLFFIPARRPPPGGSAGAAALPSGGLIGRVLKNRVMGPEVIPRVPWNIVLLFGGGFALAGGFQETGLAGLIGNHLAVLAAMPTFLLVLCVCLALTFLTELTSNAATTEMILPVLAVVAVNTGIHPLLIMAPATISASCAFMLPVATPPNAIVFGSGRLRVGQMARVGIWLNLAGALIITALFSWLAPAALGIEGTGLPDWAR